EVVKAARLQPRQHVHLRAAFDLENAEGIALAEHVVNRRLFARDRCQVPAFPTMLFDQIKCFADAGQHPQPKYVDLENSKIVDVVLVPFDEGWLIHCAVADRDRLGEWPLGEDEAANMLRQMTRHSDQLLSDPDRAFEMWIGKIQSGFRR